MVRLRFLGHNGGRCPRCNVKGRPDAKLPGMYRCAVCTRALRDDRARGVALLREAGQHGVARVLEGLQAHVVRYAVVEERSMAPPFAPKVWPGEVREYADDEAEALLATGRYERAGR